MDPFLGQILAVGFNYAPLGWATCSGQIMSIAQNSALFALLGTNFGGNGTSTFALPNLSGRAAVGTGQSPGLSNYVLGQTGGNENVTLTQAQMPTHMHPATFSGAGSTLKASSTVQATSAGPIAGGPLGHSTDLTPNSIVKPAIYTPANSTVDTALGGLNVAGTVTVGPSGGNQPVSVLDPYLALTMIIATQGIFPPRP